MLCFLSSDGEQREREQTLGDFRCGMCLFLLLLQWLHEGWILKMFSMLLILIFLLPLMNMLIEFGVLVIVEILAELFPFFDLESDSHLAQPLVKVLSDVSF